MGNGKEVDRVLRRLGMGSVSTDCVASMNCLPENSKLNVEGGNGKEVDRALPRLGMESVSMDYVASLNCLPNELLIQILSFLQTKPAASTSVLSKRWRTLFAFRHDLDFDDSIFRQPQEGQRDRRDIQESFRSFVDHTLDLQGGAPLNKFSLRCGEENDESHVDRWINNVMERGVSQLYLALTSDMRRVLPSKLFINKTMVKLALGKELFIDSFPSDTSLPVLKVMFLDSIAFDNETFSDVFLAGCPALEDLTIHHKSFLGMPEVISNKTIKKLSIRYDCADWVDPYCFILLDTPNVVQLYYSDHARPQYQSCNFGSLVRASLDLHLKEDDDCNEPLDPDVTDLINDIRNVKILTLSSSAVEVILVCCKGGLPIFRNLVSLRFSSTNEQGWKIILQLLLECSPNLTTLVLTGLDHCTVEICIPPRNKVKTLIMRYQGSANELKHIRHFLLKMECLQMVKIYISPNMDDTKKLQLTEDLLKLPKASSKLMMHVM